MPATFLQLQSIGSQDTWLTQDPQINVFKYSYYRYVNFATEIQKIFLNEVATFGKKTTCDIPKRGHLLSKLYLHIKLPQLVKTSGTYLSWTDALGYAIFSEPIELEIGGVVVDRLYPQFLNIWDEFSNSSKQLGRNFMLQKADVYIANYYNSQKAVDIIVPLDFWFTKQYYSALPLLSMTTQDIRLNFKFRDFSQVVNFDGTDPSPVSILDSNVYAEYIFLDDVVAEQFRTQKHTYIIEQIQYNGVELIKANTSIYNSSLKFNHSIKELVFACVSKNNVDNNNHFVYSDSYDNPILSEIGLLLDGRQRFDFLPEFYYRSVFPDSVHSVIPLKYVYCIPFSIYPEENQPMGSINWSRFDDIILTVKLPPGNEECYLYVFGISYNIAIVENGTLTLEFSV